MSYAIIKTGGKQFAVEDGQTLRVPTIEGKAGSKVDIQALVVGGGKDAKIGGDATVKATVVGHGRGDKVIVFKKKRRKGYQKWNNHRQSFTQILIQGVLGKGEKVKDALKAEKKVWISGRRNEAEAAPAAEAEVAEAPVKKAPAKKAVKKAAPKKKAPAKKAAKKASPKKKAPAKKAVKKSGS